MGMTKKAENPRGRLRNNKLQGGEIKKSEKSYYLMAATILITFFVENLVILHNI